MSLHMAEGVGRSGVVDVGSIAAGVEECDDDM